MTRDTAERARELALGWLADNSYGYETTQEKKDSLTTLLTKVQAEAREQLAAWMAEHSFSTGHGDTFEDLLKELDWQVKELRKNAAEARLEEAKIWLRILHWAMDVHSTQTCDGCQRIAALAQALQPEEREGTKS